MKGLFDQQGAGVVIQDDDVKGVESSPKNLTIAEGETGGATYTVVLGSEPTSAVTVTISGHAGTDLTLDKTTLTFTVDDWDTPQTVTVTAAHDYDAVDDPETLFHALAGGDYEDVTADSVTLTITDDDTSGVTIEPTEIGVVSGLSNEYTVVLDSEPTGAVTLTIRGHAGTDLSLDKTVLTFTADDWDTPQTVKVTADDDAVDDPETLTHTALGGDYASLSKDLPVTITDDAPDDVMVSFGAGTYTVAEGAASPWGWTWTRSGPSPSSSRPRTRTTPTTPACPARSPSTAGRPRRRSASPLPTIARTTTWSG